MTETNETDELDRKSQDAEVKLMVGDSSENTQKQEGDIPVHEVPEEVTHTGNPPGPASGTQFEDVHKGSTWEIPKWEPPAHQRPNDLDPQVNGPFLDDLHAEREAVRREVRNARAE